MDRGKPEIALDSLGGFFCQPLRLFAGEMMPMPAHKKITQADFGGGYAGSLGEQGDRSLSRVACRLHCRGNELWRRDGGSRAAGRGPEHSLSERDGDARKAGAREADLRGVRT